MRSEKCRKEMLRVIDRKDMTNFMRLKATRRADVVGFLPFVRDILPMDEAKLLIEMIAAGSYQEAMRVSGMEYEECYAFILNCYKQIVDNLNNTDEECKERRISDVLVLLQSGGNQFDVLRKLYRDYGVVFMQLVNRTPMRENTKQKALSILEFQSLESARELSGLSVSTVNTCIARLYHMVLDAARESVSHSSGNKFVVCLDLLDTRSKTVICREECTSFAQVRELLKREKVTGLGVMCRRRITDWLEEVNSDGK